MPWQAWHPPLGSLAFSSAASPLKRLAWKRFVKVSHHRWTGLAARLVAALARCRPAKAVEGERDYAPSRWCDQIEREISNQIIHGDPRGSSRESPHRSGGMAF